MKSVRILLFATFLLLLAACSDATLSPELDDSWTNEPSLETLALQTGSVDDLSGARRSNTTFTLSVPAGASDLEIATSGGTGNVTLFVRRGSAPTGGNFDCRSRGPGNEESCTFAAPEAGTYFITVRGIRAYTGVSLDVAYDDGADTAPAPGAPSTDEPASFPNPFNEFEPGQLGSIDNPIVVADDDFIEGVTYPFPACNGDFTYQADYQEGRFLIDTSVPGVSPGLSVLEITDEGCGVPATSATEIQGRLYEDALYYQIRGQVLRLSETPANPFFSRNFFREIPGSDQVEFAEIFPFDINREITFGEPTRTPFPERIFSCQGVAVWINPRETPQQEGEYYVVDQFGERSLRLTDDLGRLITVNTCLD